MNGSFSKDRCRSVAGIRGNLPGRKVEIGLEIDR